MEKQKDKPSKSTDENQPTTTSAMVKLEKYDSSSKKWK